MRRVLIVSHSHWETDPRVRRQVESLIAEGWFVEGLFLDEPIGRERLRTWRFPLRRRRGGVIRYLLEYGAFFVWASLWIAFRSVRSKPAIVYVNSPPDFLVFAAWPGRLLKIPVVLDVHDPMPELLVAKGRSTGVMWRALVIQERWSLRFADYLITVHEPLRDLLLDRSPGVDFDVVMNVPDTTGWEVISRRPDSRTVVYTGTVAVRYGLDDVITAMALLQDQIPNLALRVIGDGEDRRSLEALATDLGVEGRCQFVPRLTWAELRCQLDDAWVGVNVPKPDALGELSFSNKIVEWIALGLPVIAGRTSTLERYFSDRSLVYVTPGSADEIAEALVKLDLADDESLSSRLAAAAVELRRIAWPVQRQRLLGVLERATDGAG